MPTLKIQTNATRDDSAWDALLDTASKQVAELLGKPEGYVMVIAEPTAKMRFAGTDEPLAYLELKSLGLPEARTPELSAALTALVGEHLGVPAARVYIEFSAPARHLFGRAKPC
ncbi:Macrophage migration inhibitory factor (MIF) [Thiorhodovibrio winogradskyi]|uniref:L-dopachrome isomerase n=1 Tax=Thiorhodovibrio winogradskyi TaxID=77007 RepID=A0ABZ0S2J9_9GAMM|nr:phenylpyruvate tautomerase MIF-related protein [Thiorhodovibrio winogradskyi]